MVTEFLRLYGLFKIRHRLSVLTLGLTLFPYHLSQVFVFSTNFNIIIDYFTPELDVLFISTWISFRSTMCLFSNVSARILLWEYGVLKLTARSHTDSKKFNIHFVLLFIFLAWAGLLWGKFSADSEILWKSMINDPQGTTSSPSPLLSPVSHSLPPTNIHKATLHWPCKQSKKLDAPGRSWHMAHPASGTSCFLPSIHTTWPN